MAETEAQWYILHTYSGYEKKVASDIKKVVENRNLQDLIKEVYYPVEPVTVEKENGKISTDDEKLYPCYVFVKMIVTNETWYICRNTRGVTGFVGPGSQPTPLSEEEVKNLITSSREPQISIEIGDAVDIISGTLVGFSGTVKAIDTDNGKADVEIALIGGRQTLATLDISAIRKTK